MFVAKEENRVIGYMSLETEVEIFVSESDNIYNICGAYVGLLVCIMLYDTRFSKKCKFERK